MLLSKENCDFLILKIININPSMFACTSVILQVFTMKNIAIVAIALLSYLHQFCAFQLSLRTTIFCIWLTLLCRSSLKGGQTSDPLLCPSWIFLSWLPTVNHHCSSEAVVFQALSVIFMQVDKGAMIEANKFVLLSPMAVLWSLSIWTLWFDVQCLTPSVICSSILYHESDTISMEKMS